MMDSAGRLRLTDFRYAKVTSGVRTFTACGTPEYMAPEQIKATGHGFAADFWSLGILLIELTQGASPWAESSEVAMYETITDASAIEEVIGSLASTLEPACVKMLTGLLCSDPDRRLCFKHDEELELVSFLARVKTKESPFQSYAKGRKRRGSVGVKQSAAPALRK